MTNRDLSTEPYQEPFNFEDMIVNFNIDQQTTTDILDTFHKFYKAIETIDHTNERLKHYIDTDSITLLYNPLSFYIRYFLNLDLLLEDFDIFFQHLIGFYIQLKDQQNNSLYYNEFHRRLNQIDQTTALSNLGVPTDVSTQIINNMNNLQLESDLDYDDYLNYNEDDNDYPWDEEALANLDNSLNGI